MKKINLKGISEVLSEKELKNVLGGSGQGGYCKTAFTCSGSCANPVQKCVRDTMGCGCYGW